jgi:acetylglutamate kinase
MNRLTVIKIGGNVIDNAGSLAAFLRDFAALEGLKILVHGGGKIATKLAADLGIKAELVEGRRVTDAESLRVVTMVYAGLINKDIVARLQPMGCNAIGLSGADAKLITANKRPLKAHPSGQGMIDYGFVGDLDDDSVNRDQMTKLLEAGFSPVFSAITHDGQGHLLNTNADTIASVIAVAMAKKYQVSLVYCFEKKGVLTDIYDENSVVREMNPGTYNRLKEGGIIYEGMIPKMDNAFQAIEAGVKEVYIGRSDDLACLNEQTFGTRLTH